MLVKFKDAPSIAARSSSSMMVASQTMALLASLCATQLLASTHDAVAENFGPPRYFVGNYSPLTQIFGLPTLDPSAAEDDKQLTLGIQLISVSNSDSDADESLILDGELTRIDLSYQHRMGFADRWLNPAQLHNPRVRLQLPVFHQGGGFLDDSIENFHEVFNLPNGNRDELETNNLQYRYVRNGETLLDFQDESGGIGDASIEFTVDAFHNDGVGTGDKAHRNPLGNAGNTHVSLSLGVKLPTGSESKVLGSGGTDFYGVIAADNLLDLRHWGLSNQLNLGYLRAENSGPLASTQSNEIFFGRLNLAYRLSPHWAIITHFYYHQAPYKSDMEAIGADALMGNFGASWHSEKRTLTLYFGEDLEAGKSPDFSIGASFAIDLGD